MSPEEHTIHALLEVVPEFRSRYQDHLADYGELLPHVLMGEFTRWFIENVRASRDVPGRGSCLAEPLERAVAFLENQFACGGESVQELISVSFLENLWQAGSDYDVVKSALGPRLHQQLASVENFAPGYGNRGERGGP